MKLPRDLAGAELAKSLSRLGYRVTRQTGSHLRLTTDTPSTHHITIPAHDPLKIGTLAAILGDAVTGERTLPALDAAHIRPYAEHGPHLVANGLLLRADLHKLFDDGYITITETLHVLVSGRIKEEFENGQEYYKHHGERLAVVPAHATEVPAQYFPRYHNEQKFLG